ncbi:MAG: DNA replication complex GINS family protein [Methanosarcinales archaeon]|nr:DNA replication complex GINS family protein [Methanosarcinales archaeon]
MNYEELSLIAKDVEKKSDLIKFPPHFYTELAVYIQEMQNELNNTDSGAPDYHILEDELNTVQKFADKILLRRIGKIMELAGRGVLKGSSVDTSRMVAEEYDMFCDIKSVVERVKSELLPDSKTGDKHTSSLIETRRRISDSSKPTAKSGIPDTSPNAITKKDNGQAFTSMAQRDKEIIEKNTTCESCKVQEWKEYTLVRAVADIDTFTGPDGREYALKKDDVAPIPDAIAKILINRHVVVQIFISKEVGNA